MVFSPYLQPNSEITDDIITAKASAKTSVAYFTSTQLSTIYSYPTPNLSTKTVVGVISFGGGVTGSVSAAGVVTGGDIQAHWAYLGIPAANFPKVILVPLGGTKNTPNPSDGATIENIIDIETIGAMYPSPNLTIILYIAPNSLDGFTLLLNAAASPITVNGQTYKPSVISCSWGAPELYFTNIELSGVNAKLQALAAAGITMASATGDNGSSDGVPGKNVDFPSSSPYNLACGGTTLICPNRVYDSQTVETAWNSGGGGISTHFVKPAYQSALSGTGRCTPDVSLVADPNTGVVYTIGGKRLVIGGTSIVAPAMAAFLAIVNSNKFITPLLSTYPTSDFHDIKSGSNGDYVASTGYDKCTGYGSIMGTNLATSILSVNVPVTGISLNTTNFTLIVGSTVQLASTVTPVNASNKTILYSSSSPAVATVSTTGLVTGVTAGSVTITAKTMDGNFMTTATGTVPTVIPTSVTISPSMINVNVGKIALAQAIVSPTTASNKTVTWESSNTAIVQINATTGIVTGVANGTASITATTVSGGIKGTCAVTVLTPVTGITVAPTSATVNVGGTVTLVPTVLPLTASNKTVYWLSQNISIASIDAAGVVHGVKHGTTSILATAGAYSATIKITVN